jgi:anti-anti-sigma regulatory factor
MTSSSSSSEDFRLRTAPRSDLGGEQRLLVARGKLTGTGADLLLHAVELVSGNRDVRAITLDLSAVTLIEPVAAAGLLAARDVAEVNGCAVVLVAPKAEAIPGALVADAIAVLTRQ